MEESTPHGKLLIAENAFEVYRDLFKHINASTSMQNSVV